jgi:hypothetical protein
VTKLDASRQEQLHVYPLFLPDGRRFLYASLSADPQHDGIYVRSLASEDARLVVRARSNFAYVEPGFLVYAREGVLMAQPFDAEAAVTTGDPVPIGARVEQFSETGIATFSASTTGTLVYGNSEGVTMGRLLWFDRGGTQRGAIGDAGAFRNPRLSPNGSQVVVERTDTSGNRDLWIVDVARGVPTRFTFDPGRDASPVWSADGREIAWQGNTRLYKKSASGAGREESLHNEPWIPDDWLPDGSGLLAHPNNPRQIWLLPLAGDRSRQPVVESRLITTHARVSPDGAWVAFATNESGRFEVHLQHLRGATGRWQVSAEGGIQPKWRRDGRELFYLALDGTLMAVPLKLGDLPEIGKPHPLFQTHIEATTGFVWHQYDVVPDGQRFLVNAPQASSGSFTVVVNWPALLK